jgi:hypothetical protein
MDHHSWHQITDRRLFWCCDPKISWRHHAHASRYTLEGFKQVLEVAMKSAYFINVTNSRIFGALRRKWGVGTIVEI